MLNTMLKLCVWNARFHSDVCPQHSVCAAGLGHATGWASADERERTSALRRGTSCKNASCTDSLCGVASACRIFARRFGNCRLVVKACFAMVIGTTGTKHALEKERFIVNEGNFKPIQYHPTLRYVCNRFEQT